MIHTSARTTVMHIKFSIIIIIRQRRERVKEENRRKGRSLTVRSKRELKGVVCSRALFLSFALVSSLFSIERCECVFSFFHFLSLSPFFLFLFFRRLLFYVVYNHLSSFFFSIISLLETCARTHKYSHIYLSIYIYILNRYL